jgi:hypothetical protein
MSAPKERPILFSGPMVRAILEDRKTQTRRVVTPQPASMHGLLPAVGGGNWTDRGRLVRCPYGQPGDRLWVRETWRSWNERFDCADDGDGMGAITHTYVAYAGTPRIGFRPVPDRQRIVFLDESTPLDRAPALLGPWKPSIHMPRWASRLILEVTEVRVQRLQEISEEDALSEGFVRGGFSGRVAITKGSFHLGPVWPTARAAFQELWDSINGESPGCSWEANPWVWCVSFRRMS